MKRCMLAAMTMLLGAGAAQAVNYFDGIGDVSSGANWSDGSVSVPPALGEVTNTVNAWSGNQWNNMGVRQTGGYIYDAADNGLYMLQGAVCEIEDPRTDYASYTNLDVSGVFQIWHNTTAPTFRLLSGHAEAGLFHFITAPTMDIGDGLFHVGGLTNQALKGNYTFMSNKTGRVVIDDLNGQGVNHVGGCTLNFESGNTGALTLGPNTGGSASTMWFMNDMVADQFYIDGVLETDPAAYLVTVDGDNTSIARNPYDGYKRFVGQTAGWHFNPQGSLMAASNWEGGVVPSGSTTGLVANTVNMWTDTVYTDIAVRQVGGDFTINVMDMRGGSAGTTNTTLYEIDDPRTDYASYTNLTVAGNLTQWAQNGYPSVFNLLSGHVEVGGGYNAVSAGKGTINMGNGLLHFGSMIQSSGTLNMLAGGTGAMVFDTIAEGKSFSAINFESGNAGSITLGNRDGGNAGGLWQWHIANNRVSIDGVIDTDPSSYIISSTDGTNTTIQLSSSVIAFPAPPHGILVGPNLIPNGEFDQIVDLAGDSTSWFNITNSFGSFDIFDGSYARVAGWEYSCEDPSGLTNHVGAGGLFENSFYLDALANPDTEQINFNSVADLRHIMTQADALSGATLDAGTTYRFSVNAEGQGGQYDPASGTLTVALKDGGGQIVEISDTLSTWNGVKTVDISGALLTSGSVNVMLDVIGTNSIPGYPTASTTNNNPGIIAKVLVNEVSLVEVYAFSAYDVNRDGAVNQTDVDLANSYLDGSVDGGDDAATRIAEKMAEGLTYAQALDALNLTIFDVNGDGFFNAADITAIEANIDPVSIISGMMDGSGDFVVTVNVSSLDPGSTVQLKRSTDLVADPSFSEVVDSDQTAGSELVLTDENAPAGNAFYRVSY